MSKREPGATAPLAPDQMLAAPVFGVEMLELMGSPHGVLWTHADQVSGELASFLG